MCMIPPTQLFSDPPCDLSICFSSSPMRGISTIFFQMIYPLEKGIDGILLHILYLLPNIPEYCFHDMICLVNTDTIFTLNIVNVEDFLFQSFLEGIVKDSVKFLH